MKKKSGKASLKNYIKEKIKSKGYASTWNGMRLDTYYNIKDMREEAIKEGAYNANEFWGKREDGKGKSRNKPPAF